MNSGTSLPKNFENQQEIHQFSVFQPPRVEQSRFTTANFEQELENYDHGARTAELHKQLSAAQSESVELKRKLRVCEGEKEAFKKQVESLKRDSDRQHHNDSNYKALYDKEKVIYCQLKEELEMIYSDRNTVDMRRRDAEAQLHSRDVRIKHLQHENSQIKDRLTQAEEQVADLKGRHLKSSKELILREEQLRHIRGELEQLKQAIDSFEAERINHIKIEFDNGKLTESNQSLQHQIDKLQGMLNQHQQQLLRIEAVKEHTEHTRDGVDKAREYLSLALESSKIEIQTLKMNKQQLERVLGQLATTEKQLAIKLRTSESQLEELQLQRLSINEDLLRLNHENTQLRNQVIELQTVKTEFSLLKRELVASQHKVLILQRQAQKLSKQKQQDIQKLKKVQAQQQKYRIDVTRQLDSIKNSMSVQTVKHLSTTKMKRRRNKQHELQDETINKDNERTQIKQIQNSLKKNNSSKGELPTLYEQQSSSSRGRIRSRSINNCEQKTIMKPLEQLQQAMRMFDSQHMKICKILQLNEDVQIDSPMMKILSFFRQLQCKISQMNRIHKQQNQYLNEIRRLKFQLIDKEAALKIRVNPANQSEQVESEKPIDKSRKLIEFVQEEMRTQFNKMQTALSFSNEKFEVLRRKLYNQYRFRIVSLLSSKQKTALPRLEMLLQRFVEGLANQSHKQALLNRHVKKQVEVCKQNKMLKHRIHELDWLLVEKTAVCTRSPVQVIYNNGQNENIYQSIRYESQLLSCKAELNQVAQELAFTVQNLNNVNQQLANAVQTIGQREQDITKLRTQLLEVQRLHKSELVDALDEMDSMRLHSMRVGQLEEQLAMEIEKSRSSFGLKDQLNKKKQLIKGLKDRQKGLVQIIEDIRAHIQEQEKQQKSDKVRSKQETRLQQIIADLKERNKDLKAQLQKKAENEKSLTEQIQKKTGQITSLRATINIKQRELKNLQKQQQSKVKTQKKKIQSDVREAKVTATKLKRELENARKRLDQLQGEVVNEKQQCSKVIDESALKQKSMMSTIRSLTDILRTIWRSIEVKVRKMRSNNSYNPTTYDSIAGDPMKIDVLRLYSEFGDMLSTIKEYPENM